MNVMVMFILFMMISEIEQKLHFIYNEKQNNGFIWIIKLFQIRNIKIKYHYFQ